MNIQTKIQKNSNNILLPIMLSLACVGALVWLFQPFFGALYKIWMNDDSYTHGPLVPFIAAYLIWDKRFLLAGAKAAPSYKGGLIAFLITVVVWIIAVGGKSRYAIEMTFLFMIVSLVWFNYGTAITKKISFPLFMLFMMVPFPEVLYGALSRKLQLFSSKFGVAFMHLFNIPVYREGNVIHLPQTTLQVAEACSGISSLISLFTLAMIYAYISQKGLLRRLLIVLSALPIAVFMNWMRIAATGMIAHFWSLEYAQGFYHTFSGWIVFVFAFIIFVSVGSFMSMLLGNNTGVEQ